MGTASSKRSNGTDPNEYVSKYTPNSHSNKAANMKQKVANDIQNKFVVVWLDPNVNESDVIYRNTINRLQHISISLNTFKNTKDCIQFLTKMKESKILLLIAENLLDEMVPHIRPMTNIHSVYTLSDDGQKKGFSQQEYDKLKGTFDTVEPLYGSLKRETRQYQQDVLVMSIIPSINYTNNDLKQLNQLFLYWFLVKQIIRDMIYEPDSHKYLADFCRTHYTDNNAELKVIDEFEKTYRDHSPVWWYTRKCFLYVMLNRAFQTQDIEVIMKIGSFIQDLHNQIEKLQQNSTKLPIAYRSQHVSADDFEKMKTSQGSLLSFNNFMIADTDHKTTLNDARRGHINANTVGLLFRIETECINQPLTPSILLTNFSYSPDQENCVLLSMHSVFHISEIKKIEDHLWQINLKLTEAEDMHMTRLNDIVREETRNSVGWFKLAKLMTILRDLEHAQEIYLILLDLTSKNDLLKMSHIYNELGLISDDLGDYTSALAYYQKAIEMRRKCLPPNHRLLSIAYNNIGEAQRELGEYYNALSSHQKTLRIKQKTLPPNHLSFATTYNNIGLAKESLGDYSTALEFYNKALELKRKSLPVNHTDLAVTFNNMGELHREMGNFPAALRYFEKVLNIRLKPNQPFDSSLAVTYNNIGLIHREMGDYPQAITYFQKSLEVKQKTFSANHPSLATTYNNMGDINQQIGEFSEALSAYQKALEIQEKAFSVNHPDLATTFNNIGVVHQSMGNYSTALSYYQKALNIRQKSLPAQHPTIATSYNNIGHLYQLMGDYNTALEYYQKTQKLQERSFNSNHPSLGSTYNNIADIHRKLGNHKMALSLYRKSLDIKRKSLSNNHPSLVITYNNIGVIHQSMQDYVSALEYYKKTLEIQKQTLSANHPDLAAVYNNIGVTYQAMKDYTTALNNYEKALKIQEKALPANHPDLAMTHNNIATVLVNLENLSKAVEHEQKAVDIATQTLAHDHPNLKTYRDYLERINIKIESTRDTS